MDRFWSKVEFSEGCWEWQASFDTAGYGLIRFKGRLWKAHRLSYHLCCGLIGDLVVCHSCDNPKCVNPDHLWLGTKADNAHDRDRKGRWVRGRGSSKLTDDQVRYIRKSKDRGVDLARELGISQTQISRVRKGQTYEHLLMGH